MYGFIDNAALKLLPFFESFVLVFVFAVLGIVFASFIHTAFEAAQGNKRMGLVIIISALIFVPIYQAYRNTALIFVYFSLIGIVLFLRMLIMAFRKVNLLVKD